MANNSLDCWPENVCSLSDGPPGHLKNPLREFFKLFLRFFVNRGFRPLRWAMGALPLNPTIFREKSSKAFFVLVPSRPLSRPFRRYTSSPQINCSIGASTPTTQKVPGSASGDFLRCFCGWRETSPALFLTFWLSAFARQLMVRKPTRPAMTLVSIPLLV